MGSIGSQKSVGSIGNPLGILWGSFGDHLGTTWGSFWDYVGANLGPISLHSYPHFGVSYCNSGLLLLCHAQAAVSAARALPAAWAARARAALAAEAWRAQRRETIDPPPYSKEEASSFLEGGKGAGGRNSLQ